MPASTAAQPLFDELRLTAAPAQQSQTPWPAILQRLDELWNDGLSRFGGPFLAGAAFTAVDAFYAPVAFRMQTYGLALSPASQAYANRLLALEGMRRLV